MMMALVYMNVRQMIGIVTSAKGSCTVACIFALIFHCLGRTSLVEPVGRSPKFNRPTSK